MQLKKPISKKEFDKKKKKILKYYFFQIFKLEAIYYFCQF
jgi:hypothetical protein